MNQEKIGFVGPGNLGKAIADNIAKGGFVTSVYDIANAAERAPAGAFVGASVSEVAERSSAIFLCLLSLRSVEEAKAAGCRHAVAESAYEAIKELQEATPGVARNLMLPFTRDGGTASD